MLAACACAAHELNRLPVVRLQLKRSSARDHVGAAQSPMRWLQLGRGHRRALRTMGKGDVPQRAQLARSSHPSAPPHCLPPALHAAGHYMAMHGSAALMFAITHWALCLACVVLRCHIELFCGVLAQICCCSASLPRALPSVAVPLVLARQVHVCGHRSNICGRNLSIMGPEDQRYAERDDNVLPG